MKWEDYTKIDNLFISRVYVATLVKLDLPIQYNSMIKPFTINGSGYGSGNGDGDGM